MALLSYLLVLMIFAVLAFAPMPKVSGVSLHILPQCPPLPRGHEPAPPCGRCRRCLERNARSPPPRR